VEMIRAQAGALKGAPVDQITRVSPDLSQSTQAKEADGQVEEKKKKAEPEIV